MDASLCDCSYFLIISFDASSSNNKLEQYRIFSPLRSPLLSPLLCLSFSCLVAPPFLAPSLTVSLARSALAWSVACLLTHCLPYSTGALKSVRLLLHKEINGILFYLTDHTHWEHVASYVSFFVHERLCIHRLNIAVAVLKGCA